MRHTNIELDEGLVAEAQKLTGIPTMKALVDHALRELVRKNRLKAMTRHFGKVRWEGNLDEMRAMD
jgi:Arc/MetJ family transcription regulator